MCKDLVPPRVAAVLALRRWLFYDTPMPAFLMRFCFQNVNICIRDSVLIMFIFADQTQAESISIYQRTSFKSQTVHMQRVGKDSPSELTMFQWVPTIQTVAPVF